MQVQFQLDLDDIAAFSLHHTRNSKEVRRKLRIAQAWAFVCIFISVLTWQRRGMEVLTLTLAGYALFYLLGYSAYYHWSAKRKTLKLYSGGRNRGALGNHIIGIDADGITEISDVGESRIAWSGIERVEENQDYVFLYDRSFQAQVIPKRAFLSEAEAIAFFKLAQGYHSGRLPLASPSKGVIKMAEDKKDDVPDDAQQDKGMSEDEIDRNLMGSFPASDPPSWTLGINHRQEVESEKEKPTEKSESE